MHKLLLEDDKFESILCFTGQHPSLASEVLDQFDISPDYCCLVKNHNENLAFMISYLIKALQELVNKLRPDYILVQGDTLSSYCGSTIAFLNQIKLIHVEAGLRTYNKWAPFPEEVFRKINGILADIHFAPSIIAEQNLLNEGVKQKDIFQVGNTGVDALLSMVNKLETEKIGVGDKIKTQFQKNNEGQKLILVTLHRRESQVNYLESVIRNLKELSERKNVLIICPIHPNPKVTSIYNNIENTSNFKCIDPLKYSDFVWAMIKTDLIITDSGGIQEEAPYLGKPLLIAREQTERQEILNSKNCKFLNLDTLEDDIFQLLSLMDLKPFRPYGNGNASEKILKILKEEIGD